MNDFLKKIEVKGYNKRAVKNTDSKKSDDTIQTIRDRNCSVEISKTQKLLCSEKNVYMATLKLSQC